MRNTASLTLIVASAFLAVVALLVNSPALFYMGTALVATIIAARFQARYAVRGLKLTRLAPKLARQGEAVNVTLEIESERKFARPLVLIEDQLPGRLLHRLERPCLPVAPGFRVPVQVQYSFTPLRRGLFRWDEVHVLGTDALGLASAENRIKTEVAEMKVLPAPIPFEVDLNLIQGQGTEESAPKRLLSSGMDFRTIREFAHGDPVRSIHWASSVRTGVLMVREFDAQAGSQAVVLLQRSLGSDFGPPGQTTHDVMCGHAAFLVEQLLPRTTRLTLNDPLKIESSHDRLLPYLDQLAELRSEHPETISQELIRTTRDADGVGRVFLFLSRQDPSLPMTIRSLPQGVVHVLMYSCADFGAAGLREAADEPQYVQALLQAGASVQFMPKVPTS